jgi:hypothetical protein
LTSDCSRSIGNLRLAAKGGIDLPPSIQLSVPEVRMERMVQTQAMRLLIMSIRFLSMTLRPCLPTIVWVPSVPMQT